MRQRKMPWDNDYSASEYLKDCSQQKAVNQMKGWAANERGLLFEKMIQNACDHYRELELAYIAKIPEPFRVLRKMTAGRASIQFTKHAEPDFMGVLTGGQNIVFEAKYTVKDRIQANVLTDRQYDVLENCHKLGAVTGVCCGVEDSYYFVPWSVWRDMKECYGRQYMTHRDLALFEVKFDGASVKFLEYKTGRVIWDTWGGRI